MMKYHLISNKGKEIAIIYTLIVLTLTLVLATGSGTPSSYLSDCVSYENNSYYKWCRYFSSTSNGYYCPSSESSTYCGSNSNMRCSTESSYLPKNAKYLLCPSYYTSCSFEQPLLISVAKNTDIK